MKTLASIAKIILLWICMPPVLGVVFVVLPCYTLGYLGSQREWCGYKGGPPHATAQFAVGVGLGFAIALFLALRKVQAGQTTST